MEKRSSFMTSLSLFLSLFLLLIIIAALQLEASVPMKTFHYVNKWKNWSDAQQYCKEKFTDLASGGYHREDLLNELVKNGDRYVWMGLYRDPGNASVWRWTGERGDASDDANWATTSEREMKNCTYLYFRKTTCPTLNAASEANVTKDCKPSEHRGLYNAHCSESKSSYCSNGDRVQLETKAMSWHDAQESCDNKSMVLATVTQSNQHTFTAIGWIGLHIPPNTPGSYTSKDIWKWTGTDSQYNWGWGEPDHENCGVLGFPSNTLHSDSCSDRHRFVCFVDNVILVKENKTWEEALEHCRAIGSVDSSRHNHYRDHQYDLVSLQSEDDHRYARDKIQEATTNEV